MQVKILKEEGVEIPKYQTKGSAGVDLKANIKEPLTINPMQRVLIPSGIRLAIPEGYEVQLRPRSGLALKHGLSLPNTPSTIDSDYRGEIGIILINLGTEPYTVQPGERICQAVFNKVEQMEFIEVETLDETERGSGGFGHTGK